MQNQRVIIYLALFLSLGITFIFLSTLNIDGLTVSKKDPVNPPLSLTKNDKKLKVFASFYPIYEFVKDIGQNLVDVSTIVPSGIEPHDFEPTAKQILEIQNSDIVFINGAGFESWLNKLQGANIVDLSKNMTSELMIDRTPDPHFWLDPILAKIQAKTIYQTLVKLDPNHKNIYNDNYQKFTDELDNLNSKIASNLTNCKLHDFLSFHNAFGYFSKRYGLNQHSIEGLSPELAISPKKITDAISLSKKLGIDIVFTENNADPRLSGSVAKEINGKVLVLNPIETISSEEQNLNKNYFTKMLENLNNLKIALKCGN